MEKSLRWFKMRTVKNYVGIILCACVIIFIYKTFDISLFSNILSAFIPLIVGAILAYFLQPLVYKFEMFLDSFQNKKLIKYSHTISSIFVFCCLCFNYCLFNDCNHSSTCQLCCQYCG